MKAVLRNYRQSPRKVRLLADLVRGQSLPVADRTLQFAVKRAAGPLRKLLKSAAANTKKMAGGKSPAGDETQGELFVKSIRVDQGLVYKRFRPGAFGRAYPYRKKTSHVAVELDRRPIKKTK